MRGYFEFALSRSRCFLLAINIAHRFEQYIFLELPIPTSKKLLQVGFAHFLICVLGVKVTINSIYIASNREAIFQSVVRVFASYRTSGVIKVVCAFSVSEMHVMAALRISDSVI